MNALLILAVIAALAAGLLIGWLLGGRQNGALNAERDLHRDNYSKALADLKSAQEERDAARTEHAAADERAKAADLLRLTLTEVTKERDEALRSVAEMQADARNFDVRLAELREAKDSLSAQFGEVGEKLFTQYSERAKEQFKQAEELTGQGIRAMIQPIRDRLQSYEESVGKVEADRRSAFDMLQGQLEMLRASNESVRSEAARLGNSLRNAPKARGRWGEQQLKNVFETCGLSEHIDFDLETSTSDNDGKRLRPDAIVRLPGSKALVIDSKVSLNDYQDAFDAIDDTVRTEKLGAHLRSMRTHILALADKSYWDQFDDAPDYVIMFVPGEHFLMAALDHDSDLWNFAYSRRVLLATPANLIAIARTVATVWRQETLAREARRIGELGKELYDRLAKVGEDLGRAGSSLNTAVKQFNTATNSFNTRLTVTGKKLRDFNIDTGNRHLEDVMPVETLASHIAPSGGVPALSQEPDPSAAAG